MTPNKGVRQKVRHERRERQRCLFRNTMIDLASWIEKRSVAEARADLVANQVEPIWLTRYPLPNKITVDRSKDLLA